MFLCLYVTKKIDIQLFNMKKILKPTDDFHNELLLVNTNNSINLHCSEYDSKSPHEILYCLIKIYSL